MDFVESCVFYWLCHFISLHLSLGAGAPLYLHLCSCPSVIACRSDQCYIEHGMFYFSAQCCYLNLRDTHISIQKIKQKNVSRILYGIFRNSLQNFQERWYFYIEYFYNEPKKKNVLREKTSYTEFSAKVRNLEQHFYIEKLPSLRKFRLHFLMLCDIRAI